MTRPGVAKRKKVRPPASPSLFDAANPLAAEAPAIAAVPIPAVDILETVQEAETERVFTVSDFLDRVNAILKAEDVFVRGELSGMQLLPSGLYFALK
ncbi:MAG: hypothetical protein Q8R13_05745, partial [bacterium]|nr:hypothetical protein [bacterium]